MTEQCNTVLDY